MIILSYLEENCDIFEEECGGGGEERKRSYNKLSWFANFCHRKSINQSKNITVNIPSIASGKADMDY